MPTVPSTPISVKLPLSPVLPTDRFIGLRTPQNQPDATQRLGPVSLPDAAAALLPLFNLNTNNLPGTVKLVRFQTAAQLAAAPDGGDCLDNLNPATLVLGGLVWVEFHSLGYGTTLRLLYDGGPRTPAGSGLYAFRTGDTVPGDTVPVRWVLANGPQAGVPAYPQKPTGYVFAVGELVRSYVSDISTEQFFAALAATALPAPTVSTGDINWRPVSASAVPTPGAVLYSGTGTNTNGAMTQAATTTALLPLQTAIVVGANVGNGSQAPVSVGGYQVNVTGLEAASVGGGGITVSGSDSASVGGSQVTITGTSSAACAASYSNIGGIYNFIGGGYGNNISANNSATIANRGGTLPAGANFCAIIGGQTFVAPVLVETVFVPQLYLFKPGAGVSLLSPDGNTRAVLTISNTGQLLLNGTAIGTAATAPTITSPTFTAA